MDKYKITDSELESGVVAAPNILTDTPQENKSVFDRLPRLIATKVNGFIDAVISKFTDYYNKTEIDSKENVLNEAINTKANAADVYKKTETYTKGEVDSKETALSDRINAKANSADVYTKSETYTKAETDTKLDAKANASDVYTKAQTYTKEETNVAINEKVNELGAGDMAKAVYDKNNNGVVDDAEKLNGQPASYYATKAEVETAQTTANNAQTTANNAMPKIITVTIADTDLNNYVTEGVYFFDSPVAPKNIPSGSNGWLQVLQGTNQKAKQVWWRLGSDGTQHQTFTRIRSAGDTGTWSAWVRILTEKDSGMDLLWTNASPTSNFNAQTISLDLSKYKSVKIEFRYYTGEKEHMMSEILVDDLLYEITVWIFGSRSRRGVTAKTTGITFTNGGASDVAGIAPGNSDPSRCIPCKIYGIK